MATHSIPQTRFVLKSELSKTLQGEIYDVIDMHTGQNVVVKKTSKELIQSGRSRNGLLVPENFIQEKKILKYLSSQNNPNHGFVQYIEEWEDNDSYYYVMEKCVGGELFQYVKKNIPCNLDNKKFDQIAMKEPNEWIENVQNIFKQIVESTLWFHSKGICHRDLSLENIMIHSNDTTNGISIKIIDFGLAKEYLNNEFIDNKCVGKHGYMAPEVYLKKKYDPRSADVWSLGVCLCMMLIGAPPFAIAHIKDAPFRFIVAGRLKEVLKHWKVLNIVTLDAVDLMDKIFKMEAKRISIQEILNHPFITSISMENKNDLNQFTVSNNIQFTEDAQKILEWLVNDVNLPEYIHLFIDNGFNTIYIIQEMQEIHLIQIGINELKHRDKILYFIKKLKCNISEDCNNNGYTVCRKVSVNVKMTKSI